MQFRLEGVDAIITNVKRSVANADAMKYNRWLTNLYFKATFDATYFLKKKNV